MKPKEQTVRKRTYSKSELTVLLLTEAFERDLTLFASLIKETKGFFETPVIGDDWTFTVVKSGDSRELFVNLPSSKKS